MILQREYDMKKYGLIAVLALTVACGDDDGTTNNSTNNSTTTTTNNSTTVANNSTNNTANNTTNNSTNNATNNPTNNNTTVSQDPFIAQLVFRRVATENCQLSGCTKSETVNFVSGTFSNQDGRQVILPEDDGKYQALAVEAGREGFIANLKAGTFECSDSVSPDGTTYELEGFIRENGQSKTHRANITGCVVDAQQDIQIVVGLFGDLKTAFLP
jgi:hypothetical protein